MARISISATLEPAVVAAADTRAANLGRTRSWVIEQALRDYLAVDRIIVRTGPGTSSWPEPTSDTNDDVVVNPPGLTGSILAREAAASTALDGQTQSVGTPEPTPGPHEHTRREKAASGGWRKVCTDCGEIKL